MSFHVNSLILALESGGLRFRNLQLVPVDPNPPSPRSVTSRLGSSYISMIIIIPRLSNLRLKDYHSVNVT